MNKMIIMRGISGSGKSTLARQLVGNGVICSADDYFMVEGKYVFDPTKLASNHKKCYNKALGAVQQNISPVVIDNTNLVFRDMKPYLELAKKYNYAIEIAQIDLDDIDELLRRQESRAHINKAIPRLVLEVMIGRFDKDYKKMLKDYVE
jgi:hypothetical protein